MTSPPIRVGLIGFGLAGRAFHAPLIATVAGLRLSAIATSRADEVARLYPGARVCDADRLIADASVDLVVVATPNASHVPLAQAALAAGKHVVIDKPFAPDPVAGRALAEAARRGGRMLAVFHNRRWDADFLTVAQLLADGVLGDVANATFAWDRFRPAIRPGWREETVEGGLLSDLGPHLADQALLLFGRPDAVTGDLAAQRRGARVDDWFRVTLRYGARRVTLCASSLTAAARPRFAIHGDKGSFVKHGIDPQEAVLRAGGSPTDAGYGVEPPSAWGQIVTDAGSRAWPSERGDWRRFYAGIVDAIRNGTPPPVTADAAIAGLTLLDLARRSAETARTLPWTA